MPRTGMLAGSRRPGGMAVTAFPTWLNDKLADKQSFRPLKMFFFLEAKPESLNNSSNLITQLAGETLKALKGDLAALASFNKMF